MFGCHISGTELHRLQKEAAVLQLVHWFFIVETLNSSDFSILG